LSRIRVKISLMATTMRADAVRNRERILAAAREAFTECGSEAQVEEIARRAGVGVGTFYRHFESKDVLVGELIRIKLTEFAERVRQKFDEEPDPWEAFEGALREQVLVMARDEAHQRMPFASTPSAMERAEPAIRELRAAWGATIDRAKEAGAVRADLEIDDIRTLMCGLGAMMTADHRGALRYDWGRQLELFLDGVRTKPG
jgi:AcrR family transcriptional regulator